MRSIPRMQIVAWVAVAAFAAIPVTAPRDVFGEEPNDTDSAIHPLRSEVFSVRKQAQEKLIAERKEAIVQLIAQLEEKGRQSRNLRLVREAMTVLGDLQAVEAIDALVRHIGYPGTAEIDDLEVVGAGTMFASPAVPALAKIGEPCIEAVVRKLRSTDEPIERFRCVDVLRRIDAPYTRQRIEQTVPAPTALDQVRLADALKCFDAWVPAHERARRLNKALKEGLGGAPAAGTRK